MTHCANTGHSFTKPVNGSIRSAGRFSRGSFAAKAVRVQLHALAYNLGNYLRMLAMPEVIKTGRARTS
jgi:hypothetical protein